MAGVASQGGRGAGAQIQTRGCAVYPRAADHYGLTISTPAVAEIVRLGCPEVAYWLAKPENIEGAMRLMNMDADQQIVEVGRIAKQLEASGFANDPDTEDWINARKQARREGKRR